ncbi:PAS domain S-box protein [Brevibacillus ginsengisoli]|uniref:PAS domain S-box protein n=1 Tax=Brevibacillus ginsengisoli TaxID=363854 RepID=UPI003CF00E39
MYEALIINVLVLLLPVFLSQLLLFKYHEKNGKKFQWMLGLVAGLTSILCMTFPIASEMTSIDRIIWDLRLIPYLLALIYGGYRGGLVAFIILISYRFSLGGGVAYGMAVGLASFFLLVVPLWAKRFHKYHRQKKIISGFLLGLIVFAVLLATISLHFLSMHQFDFLVKYWSGVIPLGAFTYVFSITLLILLMENTLETSFIRSESKRLIENSLDTIAIIFEGNWVFVNPSGLRLFEAAKPSDMLGHSIYDFLPSQFHAEVKHHYDQIIKESVTIGPLERDWINCSGKIIKTEVLVAPYLFKNKSAIQIVIRDISDRKQTEQELNESKQRYKSIVDYHPDPIAWLDLEGRFQRINPALEKLVNYRAEEIIGEPFYKFLYVADYERSSYHFNLAASGVPQTYEARLRQKEGKLLHVNITNIPLVVNDQIVGVYGIAKDITPQKELWDKLYESEVRYRTLVEESPEAIFILQKGRVVYVNHTGYSLLGAQKKEWIIGKEAIYFVHKDYRSIILNEGLCHGKAVDQLVVKCVQVDGEVLDVEIKSIPTSYQGESSLYVVLRDVTELRKSREYLQQSEKLTVVGQLAAGIAHEIRNPLTSLRGFVQLIQRSGETENDEFLKIMLSEIDRINEIVGELLLLAKPNKHDFEKRELVSILSEVITLLKPQGMLWNIELVPQFGEFLPVVYCVENKLKQVFINIIKNAMEAMPTGGKVYIELNVKENNAYVKVVDHGCGIPKELLHKIGQAFYTSKERGTGLGTMISFSIINSHQGQINIDSVENVGTTVEIILPLVEENEPTAALTALQGHLG